MAARSSPASVPILPLGVLPLLEHFVEDGKDVVVTEFATLVYLETFNFGIHHSQRCHPLFVTGAHGVFSGLTEVLLERRHLWEG